MPLMVSCSDFSVFGESLSQSSGADIALGERSFTNLPLVLSVEISRAEIFEQALNAIVHKQLFTSIDFC